MAKRGKLETGLYRRRRRDGALGDILWRRWQPGAARGPADVYRPGATERVLEACDLLRATLAMKHCAKAVA
jgi:hypothetical protein